MIANEIARLAEGLLSVTLTAGRVQMAHFAAGVAVEIKQDQSPVTVADHESEEIILEGLARAAPGVAVSPRRSECRTHSHDQQEQFSGDLSTAPRA